VIASGRVLVQGGNANPCSHAADLLSVRSATLEPHETVRAAKRLDLVEAALCGAIRRVL
jgi:hypothetical protein